MESVLDQTSGMKLKLQAWVARRIEEVPLRPDSAVHQNVGLPIKKNKEKKPDMTKLLKQLDYSIWQWPH